MLGDLTVNEHGRRAGATGAGRDNVIWLAFDNKEPDPPAPLFPGAGALRYAAWLSDHPDGAAAALPAPMWLAA
jgi:hypothetical protein